MIKSHASKHFYCMTFQQNPSEVSCALLSIYIYMYMYSVLCGPCVHHSDCIFHQPTQHCMHVMYAHIPMAVFLVTVGEKEFYM